MYRMTMTVGKYRAGQAIAELGASIPDDQVGKVLFVDRKRFAAWLSAGTIVEKAKPAPKKEEPVKAEEETT